MAPRGGTRRGVCIAEGPSACILLCSGPSISESDVTTNDETPSSEPSPSPAQDDASDASIQSAADGEPSAKDVVLSKSASKASKAARKDAAPDVPRTRPPTWLIVLTIAIPVVVGTMWYSSWYGRPLSCSQVADYLSGDNDSRIYHALAQVHEKLHEMNSLPEANAKVYYETQLSECLQPTLDFARQALAEKPAANVHASALRTLGSMVYARAYAPNQVDEAQSLLEDTFIQTKTDPRSDGLGIFVQAQCAAALAQHGYRSKELLETLVQLLDHADASVKGNAAAALGMVGDSSTAPALKRLADNDNDANVRELARLAYEATKAKLAPTE